MMQLGLDFSNTPEGVNARRQAVRAPGRKAESARARRSDPATSQRAAAKVERFASGHFAAIRQALAVEPGTFKAIAERSGLERHAVARRLPEMERAGLVRRDGEELGCTRWCLA